jgi:hypothetical protein
MVSRGDTPIPDWVPVYPGAVFAIETLHAKYVSTRHFETLLAKDLAPLNSVRLVPFWEAGFAEVSGRPVSK